ncbi:MULTISPECIES: hypothetical protein [Acinetobacter]|uniref:hypothetical protein n=1 Tax=Acinetobacter TaxID=469 RepID=UPI0004D82434|nr:MULTISPECIES: hypothetical protein [unclassified Acinetobacter]KEC85895.1 hypothetical protein DT74_13265 [Acinetobacter sp. ETR1]WEE38798.1 hypothetical protein PYV58_17980 [Acinetobacter sp. TAC-1]
MFRKGTVTFFDNDLGQGLIELNDHQQVVFKLEDFSNQLLLPQIGERIKCVVLEQDDGLFAKFIVRLDHKNYVNDQNKPSVPHLYSENAYEHIRNVRKALKKRRGLADEGLQNPQTKIHTEQGILPDAIPDIDLVAQQQDTTVEPIQTTINDPVLEESDGDLNQAKEIEPVAQTQVDLSTKVIQNTELQDQTHTVDNIKPIEESDANTVVDVGGVGRNIEIAEGNQSAVLLRSLEVMENGQNFKGDDLYFNSQIDRQLLEKHMDLTAFQRLIQKLKVKFLYSKRKQAVKKIRSEKRKTLNPWVVIVAVVIFIAVSSVMYAMDRYKQYKVEAEMRLQQYQQEQKDKIKQQKRKAYSH